MSEMLLSQFAVSGFRSFDRQHQPIENLQKINLFIGQNNSGKSNVIVALRLFCLATSSSISSAEKSELESMLGDYLNRPIGGDTDALKIWLPLPLNAEEIFPDIDSWSMHIDGHHRKAKEVIDPLLK